MERAEPTHDANSFTFLRLILALAVVVGHSYVLGGFGEEPLSRWSGGLTSGRELAVQFFFMLSGFLLAQSLVRQPSLARFAGRRLFRIMPGYWAALIFTSLVVIPALFAYYFPGRLGYWKSLHVGE
jgi:peptidoglycan/LPS O-acetylase OafA/YrhL